MFIKNIISPLLCELATYPTIINFLTMIHYILMYNDVHYKISFMDIDPAEKKNNYITYESSKRVIFNESNKPDDLNVNVICDTNVKSVSYSNYYLYFYIIYWIVSFILIYLIYKLWSKPGKKSKLRKRFS